MKEVSIILISILIVALGSFFSQKYLDNSIQEMVQDLDKLKIEISKAQLQEENDSIKFANDIYGNWVELEKKWSMIVVHSELESIQLALISMKTYVTQGDYTNALEQLQRADYLVKHISEKEKVVLKNVI